MSAVSVIELDEKLVKAIKIMHSGHSNAGDQLKQLLEEAIKEKYGSRKPVSVLSKLSGSSNSSTKKHSAGSGLSDDFGLKKPKLLSDSKPKLLSKQHISSPRNSPSPPTISIPEDDFELKSDGSSRASSDSRGSPGLEIVDDYNVCSVCKNKRAGAGNGNKLIECAECHSSYHQECHTPPISDSDAADPRLIWYCVQCMRTMSKKQNAAISKSNVKSGSSKSGNYYSSSSTSSGSSSGKYSNVSSTSKSNPANNKPVASGATTSSSLISADKRIQIMKKRAASKKPEPPKKLKK